MGCVGSKSSGDNAAFIDEALATHNSLRAKHGAPPLKPNKALNKTAQSWADHLAKSGTFQHSKNEYQGKHLGENIANRMSSSGNCDYTGKAVTEQWYSEEKDFQYGNQETNGKSGHFTQVVWKGSEELGIGKAVKGNKCYVVANYFPAGNMMGGDNYSKNVGRPQ